MTWRACVSLSSSSFEPPLLHSTSKTSHMKVLYFLLAWVAVVAAFPTVVERDEVPNRNETEGKGGRRPVFKEVSLISPVTRAGSD